MSWLSPKMPSSGSPTHLGKEDDPQGVTDKDNVCIQPHDIDGDGKVDFALGAGWQPANTKSGGTLQWLRRNGEGNGDAPWQVVPIGSGPRSTGFGGGTCWGPASRN